MMAVKPQQGQTRLYGLWGTGNDNVYAVGDDGGLRKPHLTFIALNRKV